MGLSTYRGTFLASAYNQVFEDADPTDYMRNVHLAVSSSGGDECLRDHWHLQDLSRLRNGRWHQFPMDALKVPMKASFVQSGR